MWKVLEAAFVDHNLASPAPAEYKRPVVLTPAWDLVHDSGVVTPVPADGLALSRARRPTTGALSPPRLCARPVEEAFTPSLRAALIVARVRMCDVSPTTPRSSLDALGAGPRAYGPETPVV